MLLTLQGQAWIFLFFKPDIALSLIKKVFLPGVIVYPVGSVFIGALLNYVQKNIKTELQLKESESNLRHLNAELESRVKKRTNQLEATNEQLQNEKEKLQKALDDVKKLSGLLPICSHCKKIRDDNGYWNQLEDYIDKHSEAVFSHGICEDCLEKYYPEDPVSKRRFSSHGR